MGTRAEARYRLSAQDRSKRALGGFRKNVAGCQSAVAGLKTKLLALAGGAGIVAFTKSVLDSGDQIQKMSIRLGASTEALSELHHVAQLTGTSFTTAAKGWQQMMRQVSDASRGTGEAVDAIKMLGLSAKDLVRLRPETMFQNIADAIGNVNTEADRVSIAMRLFGEAGAELLQTMETGGEGIRLMREEARLLGLTLSRASADQMASVNDAMTRLKNSTKSLGYQLVTVLGPAIETIANWLAERLPQAVNYAVLGFHYLDRWISQTTLTIIRQQVEVAKYLMWMPNEVGRAMATVFVIGSKSIPGLEQRIANLGATIETERTHIQGFIEDLRRVREEAARLAQQTARETGGAFTNARRAAGGLAAREMTFGPKVEDPLANYQETWLKDLRSGMDQTMEKAAELGPQFMAMGELVKQAGELGAESMSTFLDATVAALAGSKGAYAEFGKAMLKWAADTLKSLAATAFGKALYYKAEAWALASNPLTAWMAPSARAAAGAYAKMAAWGGAAALGLGLMSAATAPSGTYMSQSEREQTTGLAGQTTTAGGRTTTVTDMAQRPTTIHVTTIFNGSVHFASQEAMTVRTLQEYLDTGSLRLSTEVP